MWWGKKENKSKKNKSLEESLKEQTDFTWFFISSIIVTLLVASLIGILKIVNIILAKILDNELKKYISESIISNIDLDILIYIIGAVLVTMLGLIVRIFFMKRKMEKVAIELDTQYQVKMKELISKLETYNSKYEFFAKDANNKLNLFINNGKKIDFKNIYDEKAKRFLNCLIVNSVPNIKKDELEIKNYFNTLYLLRGICPTFIYQDRRDFNINKLEIKRDLDEIKHVLTDEENHEMILSEVRKLDYKILLSLIRKSHKVTTYNEFSLWHTTSKENLYYYKDIFRLKQSGVEIKRLFIIDFEDSIIEDFKKIKIHNNKGKKEYINYLKKIKRILDKKFNDINTQKSIEEVKNNFYSVLFAHRFHQYFNITSKIITIKKINQLQNIPELNSLKTTLLNNPSDNELCRGSALYDNKVLVYSYENNENSSYRYSFSRQDKKSEYKRVFTKIIEDAEIGNKIDIEDNEIEALEKIIFNKIIEF